MTRSVLLIALLTAALSGSARGADVVIGDIDVGFGGAYKAGQWTPLVVSIGSGAASDGSVIIETVTADADGTDAVRSTQPLVVESAGSTGTVRTVFQSGRLGSDLTVRLRNADGGLLAERRLRADSNHLPAALPKGMPLWVVAGGFVRTAEGEVSSAVPLPADVTAAPLAGDLPSERLAYAAADVLLVRGDLAPSAEQAEALRRWVAGGGHLAIALGRFTDAFRSGPLADWVPVSVGETVQLRDFSDLEDYSGSDRRLPARARVRAARLGDAAEVLVLDGDGALIARSPYGFGVVTVFAIDLDVAPFSTWAGLPGLIRRSLSGDQDVSGRNRRIAAPGVTDLATQLARAETAAFEVDRPSVGSGLLILLLYAAVVGPLDYLLVHRVLRRPALTWLTLPLLVAGAAWWLHSTAVAANGTISRYSQFELVDLDVASGTLRGRSALTLYSAASTRADLAVSAQAATDWVLEGPLATAHLGWSAPPEATFGGTYREASGGLFRPEYRLPPPEGEAKAESVPLLVWGSRRFEATWQQGGAAGLVDADLVTRGRGLLEGTIDHRLSGPLKDYVVVFGPRVFVPRAAEWHPGEPIDLSSAAFERRDLDSFLTQKVTTATHRKPGESGVDYVVSESAYDPLSTDLDAVVRMLTFHEVTGGREYTGLTNVARGSDDLTSLLRMGRVVVLGRLDVPAAEFAIEVEGNMAFEAVRRSTFVRLVLPATAAEAAPLLTLPPLAPTDTDQPRPPRPD